MTALVEVKNITNSFGRQVVHEGLNMSLEGGEILGLVGGSGSGKSVLLHTILGLRRPQRGQILINGKDVHHLSGKEKRELQRNWGVLFQNGALFSGLSVLDNIALPLREHTDLDEEAIESLALIKLQMTGLNPDTAYKFPSELSGGMARRAALARALALDPALLFLDEPTSGLDPVGAEAFDELILSLRDTLDLTILIITHDLDTLVTVCDRIAMLVNKKIQIGTLETMAASDNQEIKQYFQGARMHAVVGKGT